MKKYLFLLILFMSIGHANAQVSIKDPWVRATVPGQKVAGAYLQIMSSKTMFLMNAKSASANSVEIHEMSMDNNIMRMRPVPRLELPAGKWIELKPNGYHIMLVDLIRPLKKGDTVPITLTLEDQSGQRQMIEVKAIVRDVAATGGHHGGM